MTTIRMSEAEAKRAGLVKTKGRTTRKAAGRDGATSRCVTHGETFTTDAAEDRHVAEHHGCRIEGVDG